MAIQINGTRNYQLRTKEGSWLGRVILTSDGYFMSITDYGNFCNFWSNTGEKDFRRFILKLDVDYFGKKMFISITDISSTQQAERLAMRFARKILPPLQEAIRDELKLENENKK